MNLKIKNRIPEKKDVYAERGEAEIYSTSSGKGPMAVLEKLFAKRILREFGQRKKMRILDVGTGPGWIPLMMAKAKPEWDITAIDASPHMLDQARQHANGRNIHHIIWTCRTAENIDLPDESFDLIISHFAFHEFQKPTNALKEMNRLLKKGGSIVIQDLGRTPSWVQLIQVFLGYLFTLNKPMMRQYKESLQSAYTHKELDLILSLAQLKSHLKTKWSFILSAILHQIRATK